MYCNYFTLLGLVMVINIVVNAFTLYTIKLQ